MMSCKDRLELYLRDNEISYQVQHHAHLFAAREIAAGEHIPGRLLAKVVMVVADDRDVMLVLPATEYAYMPAITDLLGAGNVRLAGEKELKSLFIDCEMGAMPPFGNLYNLPVYVDSALAREDTIFFQTGTHTDTMSMKYADFAHLVKPIVGVLTRDVAFAGLMEQSSTLRVESGKGGPSAKMEVLK